MNNNPTLFCWIGNTDIEAMAQEGNAEPLRRTARYVLQADNKLDNDTSFKAEDKSSIILVLRDSLNSKSGIPRFNNIILLTNRPTTSPHKETFIDHYRNFLINKVNGYNDCIEIKFVNVDAYSFEDVYSTVRKLLDKFIVDGNDPGDFWYNITPGTIAQQTTWIMLGKERSARAHFIQGSKHKKKVSICTIPFDTVSAIGAQASFIEADRTGTGDTVGSAPSFKKALTAARKIAKYPVNVLLTGESGTGKEVFAREIHKASGRTGDFIAINCATLSKELGIAELTGYLKGAFTGADRTTKGKLHQADKGTLFLDEIGDCPLDFQAELLRILQPIPGARPTERRFWQKGSEPSESSSGVKAMEQVVDVRIICATDRDLSDPKIFRNDLYYRIETIRINIPSLEQRKSETDPQNGIDDIKELSIKFLDDFNKAFLPKSEWKKLSAEAFPTLREHTWQGNIRELQNAITRAAVLADGKIISSEDILASLNNNTKTDVDNLSAAFEDAVIAIAKKDIDDGNTTWESRLTHFQHLYFAAALRATHGNKKEAYTRLAVNSRTLNNYIGQR